MAGETVTLVAVVAPQGLVDLLAGLAARPVPQEMSSNTGDVPLLRFHCEDQRSQGKQGNPPGSEQQTRETFSLLAKFAGSRSA